MEFNPKLDFLKISDRLRDKINNLFELMDKNKMATLKKVKH